MQLQVVKAGKGRHRYRYGAGGENQRNDRPTWPLITPSWDIRDQKHVHDQLLQFTVRREIDLLL